MEKREKLGSRLGFILLSAGCAIGMGNVWKFPFITGQNGGALFVLIYIAFLIILGVPIMTVEFAMGRASQKSPVKMYQELEPAGSKWHIHGIVAYIANWVLMMFYTVVTAWMFYYFVGTLSGKYVGLSSAEIENAFAGLTGSASTVAIYVAIVVILGFLIISFGVQKGLERVTKYMMVALLALMIILAVYACTLDGAIEGIKFYLLPDFSAVSTDNLGSVLVAAMNQSFFTLSIGIGSMAIFGSYLDKDRSLAGESFNVIILDTFVALCAGLIIFPTCAAFGVDVGAGPSLIFITLPNIFANMNGGRILGALFFLFMSFAAFSTILAVFENILACTIELFGITRKKACVICGIIMFVLSMPCVLGFNVLSGFQPFGDGTNVLDLEDFIVSNVALPLGTVIFLLFSTLKCGWGWDNFIKEANAGKGMKFPNALKYYMMIILPIIVITTFIIGIVTMFF